MRDVIIADVGNDLPVRLTSSGPSAGQGSSNESPLQEVMRLLGQAAETRCETTAKAVYNRAQERLDGLEKDQVSKAGGFVRQFRPKIRQQIEAAVRAKVALRERLQLALSLWTQAARNSGLPV